MWGCKMDYIVGLMVVLPAVVVFTVVFALIWVPRVIEAKRLVSFMP